MQKQVTQHDSLFAIIRDQQEKLAKQQEQLDRQQRFSEQQQHLLTELITTIKSLQATVQAFQSAPVAVPHNPVPPTQDTLPSPKKAQPTSIIKGTKDSIWAKAREKAPLIFECPVPNKQRTRTAPRRLPPARFFSAPPTERSTYSMTYIQIRHRFTQRQVREQLRDIRINTARIIDITLPASGVVGLLHHNEFSTELKDTLTTHAINIIDFDPRSPESLGDPKIKALTPEQQERVARHLHNATCLKGLAGMPAHIRRSVAHDYFAKGYITSDQYDYHLGKAINEEVKDTLNPVTIATLIASFDDDDQVMGLGSPSSTRRNSETTAST
jgi:hypothetical protein